MSCFVYTTPNLGEIGAVLGGARVLGVRGEADLVVDDNVDGAARLVALQLGESKRLVHDTYFGCDATSANTDKTTLAGKGSIAVQQDRYDLGARRIVGVELLAGSIARHNGVDGCVWSDGGSTWSGDTYSLGGTDWAAEQRGPPCHQS
jgi:hypothetical protein